MAEKKCLDCCHWKPCYNDKEWDAAVGIPCKYYVPSADVVEVRHGEWELCDDDFDGYQHHCCSVCRAGAKYKPVYQSIWDENNDGDIVYIGEEFAGVDEFLTDFCPNCGAKLDGGKSDGHT